jgi:DNA-binding PadR family transcriptional regulator
MSERGNPDPSPALRPTVFAILLVLNESPLHGYGIMKAVNERLRHRAILGPGTLYRTLKELRDAGLITRAEAPAAEDARRQYYKLTEAGRIAAADEAARMADLVAVARASRLIPDGGPVA